MAIKDSYPAIRPSLDLNFASSRMVDPRITFTRASTATYFDDKGVMRTAPAGVPRIDHDPVASECKGLLIEEQRTNLLTYSEQFNNATWTKFNVTVTANATIAPDGTPTAYKLVENTDSAQPHYAFQTATGLVTGTAYTKSVFVKAAGRNNAVIRFFATNSAFSGGFAYFNLVNGVAGIKDASITASSITPVGGGWFRISATSTATATTNGNIAVYSVQTLGSLNNDGDGTSGIYTWGAQLEAGTFPTSYIKTATSQVTRAADNAVMTGTNFSDWYRSDEGAFLSKYSRLSNKGNDSQIPMIVSDSTSQNIMAISDSAGGVSDRLLVVAGGVGQVNAGDVNYIAGQVLTRSFGYKTNDVATVVNGGSLVLDDAATIPVVSQLNIGHAAYFSSPRLNGHIARLAYYPKRLTNAQLQALTA